MEDNRYKKRKYIVLKNHEIHRGANRDGQGNYDSESMVQFRKYMFCVSRAEGLCRVCHDFEGLADLESSSGSSPSPIPTFPITYRRTSLRVMIPSNRPFLPPRFSSSYKNQNQDQDQAR